jgi:hypothetical protein
MTHADSLKLLTLDLISPARRVEPSQVDALTPADWAEILRMARQHRIGPMMRWQLQHAHSHLRVPPDVAAALDQQFRHWTVRMMMIQRELLRVHGILEAAGVPHVALKGAHLAYCVYPHPALRPIRDLDILIPPDRIAQARAALLASGLTTVDRYERVPQSVKEKAPHLPPLFAGNVSVELHKRIFHLKEDPGAGPDITDDPDFWHRCTRQPIAGTPITVPCAMDQLLHIIVHGVYDHQLENGPLLLSDIGFLAAAGGIDWSRLADMARLTNRERGVALARALVARYWGEEAVQAGDMAPIPPEIIDTSALLMLREHGARLDALLVQQLRDAPSLLARARLIAAAVCPPRTIMASMYPVDENSPWLWLWYPAWWWRQGSRRLGAMFASGQPQIMAGSTTGLVNLNHWLRPPTLPKQS